MMDKRRQKLLCTVLLGSVEHLFRQSLLGSCQFLAGCLTLLGLLSRQCTAAGDFLRCPLVRSTLPGLAAGLCRSALRLRCRTLRLRCRGLFIIAQQTAKNSLFLFLCCS